jgi:D-glycero-beta-D-manno-heptose-7-phosphate kinase
MTYQDIINKFPRQKIVVAGDCMLDEWIWGKVKRISPEAPVPVVEVKNRDYTPGGAANVVNNLRTLGAQVKIFGVTGDDDSAKVLKRLLKAEGVDTQGLIVDSSRPTTTKTRIIAHNQQVCRTDFEKKHPLSPEILSQIISKALSGNDYQAIMVSDYGKGVICGQLCSALLDIARQKKILITGGPKPDNILYFKGFDLVSLNEGEAGLASGIPIENGDSLCTAGEWLLSNLECKAVLITRGANGMSFFDNQGNIQHIPAYASQVYDVSGAGDTVIAVLTLALACGADLRTAVILSNYAASVVVRKVGTATLTAEELREAV